MRERKVKNTPEAIAKALQSGERQEHVFARKQPVELRLYRCQIEDCDGEIERHLRTFEVKADPAVRRLPAQKVKERKLVGKDCTGRVG
jgi:hypothetical protein